jgi:hypothetical protein
MAPALKRRHRSRRIHQAGRMILGLILSESIAELVALVGVTSCPVGALGADGMVGAATPGHCPGLSHCTPGFALPIVKGVVDEGKRKNYGSGNSVGPRPLRLHSLTTLELPPNAALRREPRGDAP